ncbi:uncharacterized protein IUM83_05569 [Phytophthora cinnamomi]|uniref:uncharacterized protein n=1 Tax=Phytophthora cinnamomi TaxID=4785 RepID=UPI00355A2F1C|nr:hypothetical protein IUM83_05569 [Phytophthora cinnamomi]
MVAMPTTGIWHWQERFQPLDVEGAARHQILNVHRSVSYDHWLKKKKKARANSESHELDCIDDNNQDKQAEIDAAFQDWLRRKRKSNKKSKTASNSNGNDEQPMPWRKPPSLHVNPKTKGKTRRAEQTKPIIPNDHGVSYLRRSHSEAESQQAYEVWLARVHQEDRIRQTQRRKELDRLEQQQREKHKITWRKKLAVCAYSTLVVDH